MLARRRQLLGHHVDMVVAEALGVVSQVAVDGCRTASGACDVDAA